MYEVEAFRVEPKIVLPKSAAEIAKTMVKDVALRCGIDIHGWRDIRAAWNDRLDRGRLPPFEGGPDPKVIAEIRAYANARVQTYVDPQESLSEERLKMMPQYTTVPLMERLIEEDGRIGSVVDVGCYYVRVLAALALANPRIEWTFVDFVEHLEQVNRAFLFDNCHYVSDYPLTYLQGLQDGSLDVAHCNRVLTLTGEKEIRRYLETFRRVARYVVFSEPCKILCLRGSLCVDDIPEESFVQMPGYRVYNYRRLFERAGFEMIHYDHVRNPPGFAGDQHFMIRGVAANPDFRGDR